MSTTGPTERSTDRPARLLSRASAGRSANRSRPPATCGRRAGQGAGYANDSRSWLRATCGAAYWPGPGASQQVGYFYTGTGPVGLVALAAGGFSYWPGAFDMLDERRPGGQHGAPASEPFFDSSVDRLSDAAIFWPAWCTSACARAGLSVAGGRCSVRCHPDQLREARAEPIVRTGSVVYCCGANASRGS